MVNCEVLEVDEPHRLSYTWVSGGENTTVTWTLKQDAEGTTHVHLDQTGFKEEQAFSGALYGWQSMANQLEKVLAD
nr:SRPBCC domain-containing protein [Alicyclobacillus contaminans]